MKKYKGGLNFGTKGKQGGGNKDLFPTHNGVAPGPMYRSPTKKITLSSGDPEEELRKKVEEGPKEKVKNHHCLPPLSLNKWQDQQQPPLWIVKYQWI